MGRRGVVEMIKKKQFQSVLKTYMEAENCRFLDCVFEGMMLLVVSGRYRFVKLFWRWSVRFATNSGWAKRWFPNAAVLSFKQLIFQGSTVPLRFPTWSGEFRSCFLIHAYPYAPCMAWCIQFSTGWEWWFIQLGELGPLCGEIFPAWSMASSTVDNSRWWQHSMGSFLCRSLELQFGWLRLSGCLSFCCTH